MNGPVMGPGLQPPLLQIGEDRVILLGQSRGEVPGDHHADIVFLAGRRRSQGRVFRTKGLVQIEPHQRSDGEADGVDMA